MVRPAAPTLANRPVWTDIRTSTGNFEIGGAVVDGPCRVIGISYQPTGAGGGCVYLNGPAGTRLHHVNEGQASYNQRFPVESWWPAADRGAGVASLRGIMSNCSTRLLIIREDLDVRPAAPKAGDQLVATAITASGEVLDPGGVSVVRGGGYVTGIDFYQTGATPSFTLRNGAGGEVLAYGADALVGIHGPWPIEAWAPFTDVVAGSLYAEIANCSLVVTYHPDDDL